MKMFQKFNEQFLNPMDMVHHLFLQETLTTSYYAKKRGLKTTIDENALNNDVHNQKYKKQKNQIRTFVYLSARISDKTSQA